MGISTVQWRMAIGTHNAVSPHNKSQVATYNNIQMTSSTFALVVTLSAVLFIIFAVSIIWCYNAPIVILFVWTLCFIITNVVLNITVPIVLIFKVYKTNNSRINPRLFLIIGLASCLYLFIPGSSVTFHGRNIQFLLLKLSNDIELNPGPEVRESHIVSLFFQYSQHWCQPGS